GLLNGSYAFLYDAANRMVAAGAASSSSGVSTTLAYDAGSRLTRLVNRTAHGSTLNDLSYTYGSMGQLLSATDSSGATNYSYDALYQLTGASGTGLNETYTYDEVGNRLSKNSITYAYNAANQLVSSSDGASYTYDKNGNLL